MLRHLVPYSLALLSLSNALYAQECPLIGPAFPAPRALSSSSAWKTAISDFESNLNDLLAQPDSLLDSNTTSFSLNIFSVDEADLLYEYHYDAPGLKGSIAEGQKLDGDTVYRIGSISKAMTVYAFLAEAGFKYFDEPVAKFIPEIAKAIEENGDNPDDTLLPQWGDITLGQLAGHLSDYQSDTAGVVDQSMAAQLGLPRLQPSEIPTCGFIGTTYKPCSREEMFNEFLGRHPIFPSSTTAVYSNVAFDLLGLALENIKDGVPFEDLVIRSLVKPLKLNRFGVETPDNSWGVIPIDPETSSWNFSLGAANPAGGFYSSSNDLARVGQSILRSTLLSPSDTRRWLKPTSHSASLTFAVGSPWEIYRASKPRVFDLYTKDGDLGKYSTSLGLSPDHDLGFTVMAAGLNAGSQKTLVSDLIAALFATTVEQEARVQAIENFAGTYSSSTDAGAENATVIKISDNVDEQTTGFAIDSFILNGVPLEDLIGAKLPASTNFTLRLQPTGLKAKYTNSSCESVKSRTSFRMVANVPEAYGNASLTPDPIISSSCWAWAAMDGLSWGRISIDELVFDLDKDDKAVSLEMRATKQVLLREGGK
ncbi:hypothetical protein FQN53_008229 [Emmonsiellopsis sp. PD_33]|nr:hypothetical protein FQN53_008229 [Emmonsiellopsis sp. PD_33]